LAAPLLGVAPLARLAAVTIGRTPAAILASAAFDAIALAATLWRRASTALGAILALLAAGLAVALVTRPMVATRRRRRTGIGCGGRHAFGGRRRRLGRRHCGRLYVAALMTARAAPFMLLAPLL